MKENTFWHTPQLRSFQIHSKTICKDFQESLWFILYSFMKMIFRSIRSLSSMDILIMSIAAFAQFVCGKNMILSSKFYIYYPDNVGGDLHIGRNHLSHACFNLPVQVNFSHINLSLLCEKICLQINQFTLRENLFIHLSISRLWKKNTFSNPHTRPVAQILASSSGAMVTCI